jgi:hypothetical protein
MLGNKLCAAVGHGAVQLRLLPGRLCCSSNEVVDCQRELTCGLTMRMVVTWTAAAGVNKNVVL